MKLGLQTTLRDRVEISGFGVHSAAPARVILHPADVDSGLVILRTGLPNGRERLIEAKWSNVTQTALCTVLGDSTGAAVATVEHLMAALSGLGVDNALVEIDGPEMPIMDGSAAPFRRGDRLGRPRPSGAAAARHLASCEPVRVERGRGLRRTGAGRPRPQARCRDRLRGAGDRPPAARLRRRSVGVPPRDRPRPHLRLRQRRQEAVAGRVRARLVAGEFGRARRRRDPQSRGPALRRRVRPPQGARRGRRPCAGRRADRRRAIVPTARATRSTR